MPDLSRHRSYLLAWVGVVAVAIVAVLAIVPTGAWVALDERRSSLRVTPDGVGAWAQSLERLGVPAQQRFTSLTDGPPRGAALVILQPMVPPTAAEVHATLGWVRGGGTLVFSPVPGSLIADSLGIELELLVEDPLSLSNSRDSLLEHPWNGSGGTAPTHSSWALSADSRRKATWVPLSVSGASRRPTLAWLPEGQGGVLVMADAEELANRTLDESIVAVTATRAVIDRIPVGDTLFFSEYHQALDGSRGIIRESYALTTSTPLGRTGLHVALAALVLLVLAGRRFGSPLPEAPGPRRSTLEHVEGLARIYEASGSHRTVGRYLIRGAARTMGLPPSTGAATEIPEAWLTRPELVEPARDALKAFHAEPPDLEALERALDTLTTRQTTPTRRP